MEDLFMKLDASVQMRLPLGIADVDDICIIRDFINLTQIGYITRGDRTDDEIADVIPWLGHCGHTLMTLANRFKKIQKVICTGDELCEIRDVVSQIGPYLQDSIQHCPDTLMSEWMLMDKYNRADKDSIISVQELTCKQIRKDLEAIKASRSLGDTMAYGEIPTLLI